MPASSTFLTAFLTSLLTPPLTRWLSRRYFTRRPDDPTLLKPPTESFHINLVFGVGMLICTVVAFASESLWTIAGFFTLPIAVMCFVFARGARRRSLRLRPTGFDYTGLLKAPISVEWKDIRKVEPDGSWFAIRTDNGARHLVSHNLIGAIHLVDALTTNVSKERFSEGALRLCDQMRTEAAAANANEKRT